MVRWRAAVPTHPRARIKRSRAMRPAFTRALAQIPSERAMAENALKPFGQSAEYVPHCKVISGGIPRKDTLSLLDRGATRLGHAAHTWAVPTTLESRGPAQAARVLWKGSMYLGANPSHVKVSLSPRRWIEV